MNKKNFTLVLCSVAAGTGLGYVIGSQQTPPAPAEKTLSETVISRAPRFGETRKDTLVPKQDSPAAANNKNSLDALLQKYARMNPEMIAAELKELSNMDMGGDNIDLKKIIASVYLSYKWGQISPKQALLQSKSMGPMNMLMTPMIMQGWAESNPEGAAAYYAENRTKIPMAPMALKTIAVEMAKSSPESAMKWAAALEENERRQALPSVISGIAENHPELLKDYVGKLSPEDLKKTSICSDIAEKWARSNWDETKKWISTLPESQQKAVRQKALGSLSLSNLDDATREFKQLNAGDQSEAAHSIAANLSKKNGAQALDWLVKNASENDALRSIPSTIGIAAITGGGDEVKEYISGMSGGLIKDTALQDYLDKSAMQSHFNYVDFEENLSLVSGISDAAKRKSTTENTLNQWVSSEPEKAKAWIDKSSLAPEDKQKYQKRYEDALKRKSKED